MKCGAQTLLRSEATAGRGAECGVGKPSPSVADRPSSGEGEGMRVLTREELAEVLKVSVRTVDAMVAAGEIPHLRMRGNLVRFYLPDVVRHLTATALTRKRGRGADVLGQG